MNFKTSVLAASVALILAGCGSDDSTPAVGGGSSTELAKKPTIAIPESGKFIDAQVEGLYYVQGIEGADGWTTADGSYDIDANDPSVKFVLGNEHGGLVLGNVSGRHISTPYEALGTQDRVVSLVRLLLTINANGDDTSIAIPAEIKNAASNSNIINSLKSIELDRLETTSTEFLTALASATSESYTLVSEKVAMDHLKGSLENLDRGSDTILTHWAKGSNWTFVQRSATQRIGQRNLSNKDSVDFNLVIHADRSFGDKTFEKTNIPASNIFTIQNDKFIEREGSNDGNISGSYALTYLSCVENDGEFGWVEENGNELPACDGETNYPQPEWDDVLNHYEYKLTDPTGIVTEDIAHSWDGVAEMGAMYECMANSNCSEKALTVYQEQERDDSDKQDQSKLLLEIMSGSYDPITDVYTETRSKEYLNGNNEGRISESISFTYPVEKPGVDRYVDFKGTWEVTATDPNCPGTVAKAQFEFTDTGVTMTGDELNDCNPESYNGGSALYTELAAMDYWWFGTNAAGVSKATLDQLNTTIRWNDREDGENRDHFKINRFNYIPAGVNWDRGVLTRFTLNDQGDKIYTETWRKIAN